MPHSRANLLNPNAWKTQYRFVVDNRHPLRFPLAEHGKPQPLTTPESNNTSVSKFPIWVASLDARSMRPTAWRRPPACIVCTCLFASSAILEARRVVCYGQRGEAAKRTVNSAAHGKGGSTDPGPGLASSTPSIQLTLAHRERHFGSPFLLSPPGPLLHEALFANSPPALSFFGFPAPPSTSKPLKRRGAREGEGIWEAPQQTPAFLAAVSAEAESEQRRKLPTK